VTAEELGKHKKKMDVMVPENEKKPGTLFSLNL